MINRKFQILIRYLDYFLHAVDKHSLHSPFLFQFYNKCILDRKDNSKFDKIERIRQKLLRDDRLIQVNDLGAGSINGGKATQRKIKDIASVSLSSPKFGRFIYRVCESFQPETIIELGTSFGITSLYMALGGSTSRIFTFEGCSNIASVASEHILASDYKNIYIVEGDLSITLAEKLKTVDKVDIVYFDANHQYISTLNYFELCLRKKTDKSIFIFDDIHWSQEMEKAWQSIINYPEVTLSIDVFDAGLVFFHKGLKKQHYVIEF